MELTEKDIINKVKEKKELSGVHDSLVSELVNSQIKKYHLDISNIKKADLKLIVKDVRAELRMYTGRFQLGNPKEREKFLKNRDYDSLLETHSSTKERLEFYPELKKIISDLDIKSILDLGCGLNPLALATPDIKYYASDINEDELQIISKFFTEKKIRGYSFFFDLKKTENLQNLPKADLCLIFKVLDVIEVKDHKLSEKIITSLDCKYIIASFSTMKLSGRRMNYPRREWIEKMLKRLNYKFKSISSSNEIFYIIEKN